ncbi:tetratricopeptide repeat protein [Maridesulfovibrio sp.]|uniref:tetratricopeptide repeat protein n=1 Tax=Maridesulfovibrio sp. TaxID=2795000 RepID=UPI002A188EF1|nr:tetratricopeptide repeat protein [Maridesulfovibrio sp.]
MVKKIFRSLLVFLILGQAFSMSAFAASDNTKEPFETWLEKYGAWDILEKNYSSSEESPDLLLKRADTAFKLGRFTSCLNILQSTPAFADKEMEINRLWLGGRCQRALGDPVKAVIWFSQAARLMDADTLVKKFNAEPQLKVIWFDVWRSLYWGYFVTPASAKEARRMLLVQSFEQAEKVWPTLYFIVNGKKELKSLNGTVSDLPITDNSTLFTDEGRLTIAQSLAAASLGEWDKSNSILKTLGNSTVSDFWLSVNSWMENGSGAEKTEEFDKMALVHPSAFFKAGVLDPVTGTPALWLLASPSSPSWSVFRKKLLEMTPENALETIDRETGSLLLSSEIVNALQNYRLAFALLGGNLELAENVWKRLDKDSLPMSLRIAAGLIFKPPFSKMVNSSDFGRNSHMHIISDLCSAAGLNYFPDMQAPFWALLQGIRLNNAINAKPLDRLLVFTDLASGAEGKMDETVARRSAFLFPDSRLGAESLIYLAERAAADRDFQLSAFYLKRVNQDKFGPEIRLKWLKAAVDYDLGAGNDAKALNAYNEILESGGTLSPEKELKLALMIQQKGDLKKAQAILERIWENGKTLNNELKAEILFWIAEGEHAMGEKEKALGHYLKLAWEFPEQNIWAVTAMYRASMIYEHKGQYETARRFLKTVIKRADRKAQKEAATARLNAIDSKLAKIGDDKGASFPF